MLIRDAARSDLEAITQIYNHEVRTNKSTFDTEPRDPQAQADWFASHQHPAYPLLVAEREGEVVGWGALSPWSERGAYGRTVEGSLFVKEGHRHSGIGLELARALLVRARQAGHRVIIGRIEASNEASRQLMLQMGFRSVGIMHEVGEKFGEVLDVEVLELTVAGDAGGCAKREVQSAAIPAPVTLRPFRSADADACFQIRADAYVHDFLGELGAEAVAAAIGAFFPMDYVKMARDGALCVAENTASGKAAAAGVLGFCVVRRLDEETGELFLIYVRRDAQHRGIGRLLVHWAESWLRERLPGLGRIVVDTVIPRYNQRFYEHLGYEFLSRRPHDFPGRTVEAVRLVKHIFPKKLASC